MTIIKAESAAIVAEIRVAPGDEVSAGTVLIVTELMKMCQEIRAAESAVIKAVHVCEGEELRGGEPLLTLQPSDVSAMVSEEVEVPRAEFAEFESRMALLADSARPKAVAKRHGERGPYSTRKCQ